MAIIKILQVRTTLKAAIEYICNPAKTNGGIMVSSNCAAPQFPSDIAMAFGWTVELAERMRRSGGSATPILAHHIIQSFAPGEVSPNDAHDLGVELIERITGGEHDYVVATHQDRSHIHNHIMFNPVNKTTLKRYRMTRDRAKEYRRISNELTAPLGLSVTHEYSGRDSHSLAELYAKTKGKSIHHILALKIDEAVRDSAAWPDMVTTLSEMGVEVELKGENVLFKDTTTMQRPVRGRRLGPAYTQSAIMARLGREAVCEFIAQPSLITTLDEERLRIRLPGKRPATFFTVHSEQVNSLGKTSRIFLSESSEITLTDKHGNYAGQLTAPELYEYFSVPDPLRNINPTMPSQHTERGLTERQKSYYRWIDSRVEKLRSEAAVVNLLTEYRSLTPEHKELFRQALNQRIEVQSQTISTMILDRQHREDHHLPTGDLDYDITQASKDLNHLKTARNQITPPERKRRR